MNVSGSAANLMQSLKNLKLQWEHTGNYWRDVKRIQFEQKYIEQLPHDVARATVVIKEIADLLKEIRKDCE
ncbi:MAG TPA: hypothetical protein VFG14_01940 [Chthoniobacteraceae bacterium]|jgi:hypothetical protein|nr:hypothetical protein [Chthoniobacteraceae bacterium]